MSEITDAKTVNLVLKQYKTATDLSTLVCVFDGNKHISYVNDRFVKIYGIAKEEALGQSIDLIKDPSVKQEAIDKIWETLGQKKIYRGKFKSKAQRGVYVFDLSVLPVTNLDRSGFDYVFLMRDITPYELDRKKRESNFLKQKTELMSRFKTEKIKMQQELTEVTKRMRQQHSEVTKAKDEAEKYRVKVEVLANKLKEASSLVSFDNILMAEIVRAKRYGDPLSFIVFGIDKIESILNFIEKDYLIDKMVYSYKAIIQDSVRLCDYLVREGDSFDFILLLPETPLAGAKIVAEKISEKLVKQMPMFEGKKLTTTFVVDEIDRKREDAENALQEAQTLLQELKEEGRGRIVLISEYSQEADASSSVQKGAKSGQQIKQLEVKSAKPEPKAANPSKAAAVPEGHDDDFDEDFLDDDFFESDK